MASIVQEKSFSFALSIIKLGRELIDTKREDIISKQVLKSGTSIGANIEEALGGYSKKDFIAKMGISYKEARETEYWLRLLKGANLIEGKKIDPLISECSSICKMLYKIVQSSS
jgi:four helix bundle protein